MATWKNRRKYKKDVKNIEQEEIRFNLTKLVKREALFTVLSIIAIVVVTFSSAYAVFTSVQRAENYNTLKTGTLQIDFQDNESGMGNIINLNGAYPVSDTKGQETEPYTFTVTNEGSLSAKYKIRILDDEELIIEDNCQSNLLSKEKIKYSLNGGTPQILGDTSSLEYQIHEGLLDTGTSKTHSIRIWIDETSGNEVLGTHYHGKVVVEAINFEANTMKAPAAYNSTDDFYTYRTTISSITFNTSINIPTDGSVIGQWDMSEGNDGSVQAYVVDDGTGTGQALFIESEGPIQIVSGLQMFSGFSNLETINNLETVDTSKVTIMTGMFTDCINLRYLDVGNFDTSNVTSMNNMFNNCRNVKNIDVSGWNTSKVTDMGFMFYNCNSVVDFNVSNFNTAKVGNMRAMFSGCNTITTLDLSNFTTLWVSMMEYMFQNCTNLTSLDVSNFTTLGISSMQSMFSGCTSLTSLDLTSFNTASVLDMRWMFFETNSITEIKVSSSAWASMDYVNTTDMFHSSGVSSLTYV